MDLRNGTAKDSKLEDAVYVWFTQKRSMGEPISGPLLCEKALQFNEKLGGSPDFKASSGWLKNSKSRHGIRELQIEGEKLSGDVFRVYVYVFFFFFICSKIRTGPFRERV